MSAKARQLPIDALKVIASQLIVLHHFSAYGPLADTLSESIPVLMGWLYDYARMAVQVFLVVGGYLTAASLAQSSRLQQAHSPLNAMLKRYRRLVLPFLAAMLMAVASASVARQWMSADFIPDAPTWTQIVAHVFLMQGFSGHAALSAGVWYVAIDFQLFVLMTLLMWLSQRQQRTSTADSNRSPGFAQTWVQGLVVSLILASLFFFNRDPAWDNWAIYFFGAYGMGAVAFWAGGSQRPALYLVLLALTGTLALLLEFRTRIALALAVALTLGLWHWAHSTPGWRHIKRIQSFALPAFASRLLHRFGQSSYALFLVHFPVLMLGNALFVKLGLSGPFAAAGVMLICWASSLALAQVFERWVEAPLAR